MTRWTTENTEGFNTADLDSLNRAQAALEDKHKGADPQNIADMLNNAWFEGATANDLFVAVDGRNNERQKFCELLDALYSSQAALARDVGMSANQINNIYLGKSPPSPLLMRFLTERMTNDHLRKRLEVADSVADVVREWVGLSCDQ